MQWWLVALVSCAALGGVLLGLVIDAEDLAISQERIAVLTGYHLALKQRLTGQLPDPGLTTAPTPAEPYTVLSPAVWSRSPWGSKCSSKTLTPGEKRLCELPSVWKDCSAGIYFDVGTNLGVQIRKLYNPEQFVNASVLPLFNATYGFPRNGVCALGVEANPVHTPYLTTLNDYFRRAGYQALVLTEVAASVANGKATFHLDHGSPVEWGASLAAGAWQRQSNSSNEATVQVLDIPTFVADVVRPIVRETERRTGKRPPVGMKMDVEGEEWAIMPSMIVNGGLCDLTMIYLEPHHISFRSKDYTNMTLADMEGVFSKLRRANPGCKVEYTHLDDESYLYSNSIPFPK